MTFVKEYPDSAQRNQSLAELGAGLKKHQALEHHAVLHGARVSDGWLAPQAAADRKSIERVW